ncbi:hypothetical protein [Plantactinospora soyae]|uniref:Uncharacterized protein n=1 Tax=Plantactinospora soyae TaxID=1544732 RepID=A0A927MEA6_9ACTN|nr:hypothetical protein [Plantactinospora soyae]MBE1489520.1 hypothetical protein [Plantactinospora soyae]
MQPSGDLQSVLCRHGFEEILAVPAVPDVPGSPVRYDRAVTVEPGGQTWYVRAFGTGFSILPPQWLRGGLTRVYSLDGPLLLAQAVLDTEAEAAGLGRAIVADLASIAPRLAHEVRPDRRRWSLVVAAELAVGPAVVTGSTGTVPG